MKQNSLLIFTASTALILSACGQGFKSTGTSTNTAAAAGCTVSCSSTTTGTPSVQQQLSQVDMTGTAGSSIFANMTFIKIDPTAEMIDLELPMGSNPLGLNATYPIPQLPGAKAGMIQDSSGNWFLGVQIPLSAIAHGVTFGNAQTLPDGAALPGVPSGELPSLELNIGGQVPVHLYIGVNVVAAFIELPQTDKYMAYLGYIPVQLSFDLKNSSKEVVGILAPVAPVTTGGTKYSGGIYIATKMPAAVGRLIDDLF